MLCPNCKKEAGNAKYCPECGANLTATIKYVPQKKKGHPILRFLGFVFVIGVVGTIIGSITSSTDTTYTQQNGTTTQTSTTSASTVSTVQESLPDLEILDYESTTDGYLRYVVGHIRNNTDKTYSYAQVSINLYNNETLVGSTLANVNNLEAGGTWEFKALITSDDANQFKIVDVTGF